MTWPHPLTHWTTHPPNYPCTHLWVGVSLQIFIFKQNWIISIRSRFIKLLLVWPDHTHWPTQPPTHQPMGGSVSTNHYPTHQPTHPLNYTHTHGWGIFHRFQIFKQNWIILISSSVIEFWLILGSHLVVGLGWGWMWVCGGAPCTMHHAHTSTHACTHTHVKHDKHGCLHFGGHLQFLYMYTCVCMMCVCMHVHVHVCRDTPMPPDASRHPPTHLPPPQSHREPKTPKFNKSWTNQDISILFEDSLPPNIPELI